MTGRRGGPALPGVLILLAWMTPVRAADLAGVVFPGESRTTARRLAEARKRVEEQKWAEALEELQAVIEKADGELVPLTPRRSVQARRLCHALTAALPPPGLRLYRNRADPQARKWLDQATATRDVGLLRRIVDEAFCSRPAEKALDLLGDVAFARGDFAEAAAWWALLAPLAPPPKREAEEASADLAYPDPQGGLARVQAKQLLARLFQAAAAGQACPDSWKSDLQAFRARHPSAEGTLAGRKGRYASLLEGLAAECGGPHASAPHSHRSAPQLVPADPSWTTFGGDAARGLLVPPPPRALAHLSGLCRGGPAWQFDLERRTRLSNDLPPPRPGTGSDRARALAFHPVLVGHHLLVADARYVTAYDLRTGEAGTWYDAAADFGGIDANLKLPAPADLRYTLTVAEGCVFARLGAQELKPGNGESLLVCLDLEAGPAGKRLRWYKQPRVKDRDSAVYEGTPVVHDGRVYIAVTRYEGGRTITAVECYPAHPEESSPPTLWQRDLCETHEKGPRYRHHLLTLAGPQVVYCSHSGAVIALDAVTGNRTWAVRYPRQAPEAGDEKRLHGLAPCLFAAGRLYVAPADSDRLLCLDPATGEMLWEREGLHAVHLLGVGQDRLIFATRKGVRAVGAADGGDAAGWAIEGPSEEFPDWRAPMGRGLLIGDLVLWPTAKGQREIGDPVQVYAVRQRDGEPAGDPTMLHRVPAGNLVYAHGCLAVAEPRTLSVFVPPALLLEQRRRQALQRPASPAARLELGRAEADAGLTDRALDSFTRAERLAGGRGVGRAARAARQALLLDVAERAAAGKVWDEAEEALARATAAEFPPPERLRALLRAARLWQEVGQPARAITAWQTVLASGDLRHFLVQGGPAGVVAAGAVARLCAEAGDKVHEEFERKARALWEGGAEAERPAVAERLAREFPRARVTRTALGELARRYEQAQRPGAAAHAYRRLLTVGCPDRDRAAALIGLARAYEKQRCREAARAVWQQLDRDHGDRTLAELASDRPIHDYVADHIRNGVSHPRPTEPTLPLLRAWETTLGPEEVVLPVGGARSPPAAELWWTGGPSGKASRGREPPVTYQPGAHAPGSPGVLTCRAAATGKPCWERPLPFVPAWVGRYTDRVVACGNGGGACLRLEDGGEEWMFRTSEGGPLAAFQLAGGRLFFLQGGQRLFAVDVETGSVLWSREAPGAGLGLPYPEGLFFPSYYAGGGTVLVQGNGRRWLLDAATGRRIHDSVTSGTAWPRPPCVLDERTACLVPDPRHVILCDITTGRDRWTYPLPGVTTLSGEPPSVVGLGDTLLFVTPTNIGYELQRLDRSTGRPAWDRPRLFSLERVDTAEWTLDREAVYLVAGGTLSARSLADGRLLWERPLAGGNTAWRLRRAGDYLFASPSQAPRARFRFRWLSGTVQWEIDLSQDGHGGFPVVCCDPKSGRVVERLNFHGPLPRLSARFRDGDGIALLPEIDLGRVQTPAPGPDVQICSSGLVVGFGRRVWGLRSGDTAP